MCFLKTEPDWSDSAFWISSIHPSAEVFQGLTSPCSLKSRRCGAVHLSPDLCGRLPFEATGYVYVRPFARLFLEVAARLFEAVQWTEGIPKAIQKRLKNRTEPKREKKFPTAKFVAVEASRTLCRVKLPCYHMLSVFKRKVLNGADCWGESHYVTPRRATWYDFDLCRLLFSQHLLKAMPTRTGSDKDIPCFSPTPPCSHYFRTGNSCST